MKITSNFDSGNIEVIKADSPEDIQLTISPDTKSPFAQWFYFRLEGVQGFPCKISILHADKTTCPEGWVDYRAVASYDLKTWFRVPTCFDGQTLQITHMPQYNSVFYAYFAPFSHYRHLEMIHKAQLSKQIMLEYLGQTIEGRNIDLLIAGEYSDIKPKIWITARQHSGETMSEWFIQGLIERITDQSDPISQQLLNNAIFYIVPNMNIDGSIHGNIKTNAAGYDLNRAWRDPDPATTPEVYYARQKMMETGVDLFLDIQGEETIPYCFAVSNSGIPSYTKRIAILEHNFRSVWKQISPDFQDEYGYETDKTRQAKMEVGSKWVGENFDCLSLIIKMPFKDNNNLQNSEFGWSPERSKRMGASLLNVIHQMLKNLR